MKNKFLLSVIMLLFFGKLHSQTLIAHYPFNGNANDVGPNGLNCSVNNGAALTTDRNGFPNSAYYFDGVNDYLSHSTTTLYNAGTGSVSIVFWYRYDTDNQYQTVLDYVQSGVSSGYMIDNYRASAPYRSWRFVGAASTYTTTQGTVMVDTARGDTLWHHAAFVINGTTSIKYYKDGVLTNTFTPTGAMSNPSAAIDFCIGRRRNATGYYKGKLDDIAIYSGILDTTAIDSIMNDSSSASPIISHANDTAFCDSVLLTASAAPTGWGYQWYLNGFSISGATLQTYAANTTGGYTVAWIGSPSSPQSPTASVIVHTGITPNITQSGATLLCTTGGLTFQWYKNGSSISGATSNSYGLVAPSSGTYYVQVHDSFNCVRNSNIITITKRINMHTTNEQHSSVNGNISIYPNPTQHILNVKIDFVEAKDFSIELYDALGRKVYQKHFHQIQQLVESIEANHLDVGVYFLKIQSGNEIIHTEQIVRTN